MGWIKTRPAEKLLVRVQFTGSLGLLVLVQNLCQCERPPLEYMQTCVYWNPYTGYPDSYSYQCEVPPLGPGRRVFSGCLLTCRWHLGQTVTVIELTSLIQYHQAWIYVTNSWDIRRASTFYGLQDTSAHDICK